MTINNQEARRQMCSIRFCGTRHRNIKYTVCNAHKEQLKRQKRQEEKDRFIAEQAEAKRREMFKQLGETPFGFGKKFKSTPIKDIPDWYIKWLDQESIWNYRVSELMRYRNEFADF